MPSDADSVFHAACRLPETEFLTLVSRLIEKLPSPECGLSLDDPELEQELDRRFDDEEQSVSWATLRDEVR